MHDFDWDANGNRQALAYPNGTATSYAYDTLNRLTSLTTNGPLGVVQGYAFTLGAAGNRERIDESEGISRAYGYDALYRLTSETVTVGGLTEHGRTWTYDDVGNRQQQVTTLNVTPAPGVPIAAGTLDYSYDGRDRLLTETLAGGGTTSYGYDANGNLTTKSGGTIYTWDFDDRLIKVQTPDGTLVETAYDADGNRVQTKTTLPGQAPKVTDYLLDTSGALSHVVAEIHGTTNALEALYVRGADELLSVMRPDAASTSGWQTRFYAADGIGSVRRLTDETGEVADTYTYDAFGVLLVHTGTDPQPYAFTGEPYDPNVGFQYHRARWMDPRVGSFASQDPFEGLILEPPTLHRYLYANADPLNRTDPSGYFSNLIYGQRVHDGIGDDFELSGALRESDWAISRVLGGKVPFVGRLRPDLIDFLNKQIYEIKTIRGLAEGQAQLTGYLLILNWADPDKSRPWARGTAANYRPPSTIPLGLGAFAIVGPPVGGVITYDVFDLKLVVAALATVAVMSMSTQGAQLGVQVALASLVVAFGGF